jgi:hypothetical protein
MNMNLIDACVLGMLAILDLALIVQFRRRRSRAVQAQRIMRSLEYAIRQELDPANSLPHKCQLARAS